MERENKYASSPAARQRDADADACMRQPKEEKKKTICSAARLTVDNELTLQDKVSESIETVDLSFSPSHRSGAAV